MIISIRLVSTYHYVPTVGNDNPLQYSCLENAMHRGAWQARVHGVTKSRTWLSDLAAASHIRKRKRKKKKDFVSSDENS